MKKVYLFNIPLLIIMTIFASCSSAPKNQGTPAPEAPQSAERPERMPVSEEVVEADSVDTPVTEIEEVKREEIAEVIEEIEEMVDEEPVLADAEEEPPVEIVEPEPPVLAIVPEPEPPQAPPRAIEPPPPARPVPAPRPETPRVTVPPPPAAPPPPPVLPPVEEEKPSAAEEPPVIVQEPPPRIIPELPNPTPGISSRQDAILPMVFSRMVRATVGQLVEVPFRGTGWVYLGEAGAQRGIVYDSRRLEPEGQSFIFRTERTGEYALKFYRQDFIRDFIINDYVQVIVGAPSETAGTGWFNPPVDRGRVIAEPRWPSPLAEAQAIRADNRLTQPDVPAAIGKPEGTTADAPVSAAPVRPSVAPPVQQPPASPPTVPPASLPTPSAVPPASSPPALPNTSQNAAPESPVYLDPAVYLEKAQEEFEAGRVASAISFLDQFCEHYPSGTDEVWWLYGQFYEANSPSRNILAALNSYRRLVQEYPQSSRFDDARKRIAYLQRYYININ